MAIFPKEILESTSQYYLDKIKVSSKIIYMLLTIVFIGSLLILPYIYIDLSINARGILAPKSNRVILYVPVTGSVIYNAIHENAKLNKGDTICIVNTQLLDTQINYNTQQKAESELYLSDLKRISAIDITYSTRVSGLNTEVYKSSLNELVQRLIKINDQISMTKIEYSRDKKLYDEDVISSKEFEKTAYEYRQSRNNYRLAKNEKLAKWEIDEHKYKHEIEKISLNIDRLEKERERYFLTSPITGVVQQYNGTRVGSFVYANQKIAEISPNSTLIAEMYVSPADIGFIAKGIKVKIQVDAFNYNQWGMINGEILEISDDIILIEQRPFFLVKCSFQESFLSLKNGYRGYLKKGMTVGGRVKINRRSLYQLLYDKVDDWLNPTKA